MLAVGAEPTNGDGFGLGWYGEEDGEPALYRSESPAWSDSNLRERAAHVASHALLVHVRAAIGSPVQQTNCHPFRHGLEDDPGAALAQTVGLVEQTARRRGWECMVQATA